MESCVADVKQQFEGEKETIKNIKKTVRISNDQISQFKEDTCKRVDRQIEDYRYHVAELEAPQKVMRKDMDLLKMQMIVLTNECNDRKVQLGVHGERIDLCMKNIKDLQKDKVDFKEFIKTEAEVFHMVKSSNARFEQVEKTLRESIDYMVRF